MAALGELLFYSGFKRADLSNVLRHNETNVVGALVDRLPDHAFKGKSDAELVAEVLEQCTVEPIVLELDKARGDVQETTVTGQDVFGDRFTAKGLRVIKEIPFRGDAELFELQPSTFDLNPPRGTVRGKTLLIGMDVRENQTEEAVRFIDENVAKVQTCIDHQADAIAQSNARLAASVEPLIAQRRARLSSASEPTRRLGGG